LSNAAAASDAVKSCTGCATGLRGTHTLKTPSTEPSIKSFPQQLKPPPGGLVVRGRRPVANALRTTSRTLAWRPKGLPRFSFLQESSSRRDLIYLAAYPRIARRDVLPANENCRCVTICARPLAPARHGVAANAGNCPQVQVATGRTSTAVAITEHAAFGSRQRVMSPCSKPGR
jgi:hypothetical protein